ncbi:MAG: SMI1/KNR4 family protein [Pirellulales bacterium]|nr:SMI1/KNR4 family protein [Pirellulales bacterium]
MKKRKSSDVNDSGVNRFIPVRQILAERKNIEELSARAFPIAWAEGGNYVLIDLDAAGAVFFWDHETAESTKLADDFDGFLATLQPFNVDDIELKPGQVKSVWVDPDFLKEFGDG